jgi:hypothetical protein
MAVMVPRETVTEHRLDALEKKVDEGFARVDKRFEEVDKRIDEGFARVDERFEKLTERIDAYNRTVTAGLFVVVAALIGTSAF